MTLEQSLDGAPETDLTLAKYPLFKLSFESLKMDSKTWFEKLSFELNQPYSLKLHSFLQTQIKQDNIIHPEPKNYFRALQLCSFENTKVIILGQDPYHGAGQAHGLAFSVPASVKLPPSLKNIYKELESDLQTASPKSGDLSSWAKQGVLLLNTTLTVADSKPGSHQNQGWQIFTDKILQLLVDDQRPKVFVLWGAQAQQKMKSIDFKNHCVLQAPHPSPLSCYRGFFGSRPFSQANEFLHSSKQAPVNWS
jgi:uracil-DNA glycosylase